MSMKVIDGARTLDGANFGCDLPPLSIASGNTRNSTGVDMSGHYELIANVEAGVVNTSVAVTVQESNESAANFTNITGAVVTMNTNNTSKVMSVDWKHPDRKKYARLQGITAGGGATLYGATTLRVAENAGPVSLDSSVVAV